MLEQIIRPFQSPPSFARRRIIGVSQTVEKTEVIVRWGSGGTLPSPTLDPGDPTNGFKINECDDNYTEKKRDVTPIVVTGKDGESTITFERIKSMQFGKKNHTSTKIVGAIRTETTTFADTDPFAGTVFGDVPATENCNATFNLRDT